MPRAVPPRPGRTPFPSTPGAPTGGQRPALAACRARALHPHFAHVDSYGTWSLVTGFFLPGSPITWPVSALGPRQGWAAPHCVTPRSVDPSFRLRTSGRPRPPGSRAQHGAVWTLSLSPPRFIPLCNAGDKRAHSWGPWEDPMSCRGKARTWHAGGHAPLFLPGVYCTDQPSLPFTEHYRVPG